MLLSVAGLAFADDPVLLFNQLPTPLKLPAGLTQTIPVNKAKSFYGDAFRVVDCTEPADSAFGTCGNQLFGGFAVTDSHLSGDITLQFSAPVNNITHFTAYQGVMRGDDTLLTAPMNYAFPLQQNQVSDALQLSSGDLDLTTGGVTNLNWNVLLFNTGLLAIGKSNPKLTAPVVNFPGVRGHAWARFHQRSDGLLDFYFRGSTFLPLGETIGGDPFRFPLPFCDADWNCSSVIARGTSLHPHLYLDTSDTADAPCGTACPEIPENTQQEFTIHSYASNFGDDFSLDIPELGGAGPGRSHLQGRLQIQFGSRNGDTIPFVVTSLVPSALFATAPESAIAGHGVNPGLLGQPEFLKFPLQTYALERVAFVDEPYNLPQGEINVTTGRVVGDMEYPSFYGQSLADALFNENSKRLTKDPFFLIAARPEPGEAENNYARFERGPGGETVFRYSGEHRRSFATYLFPKPNLLPGSSWVSGPAGNLDLFLNLQAAHVGAVSPVVKQGQGSFVSSLGDTVTYSYSVPCNSPGGTVSFRYANDNRGRSGGTFEMQHLASVSCTNSPGSVAANGDYDTISFTGFGTWSKDEAFALPRFSSVSLSLTPGAPYTGIIVFQNPDLNQNVVLSAGNNRPANKTRP
jgi:hypothetical protein